MNLKTSEKEIVILAFGKLMSETKRKIKDIEDKGIKFVHEVGEINQMNRWIDKLKDLQNKLIKE